MDWSKTKTIFIITFLMLNIFLGTQLYSKVTGSHMGILSEETLPERLESNRIEVQLDEPEEVVEASPITVTPRIMVGAMNSGELVRQDAELVDDLTLYSELDSPYRLVDANLSASVNAFLQQYVFQGERYAIASYYEEEQKIGLLQTHEGRKIDQYEETNYHLILHVNDDFAVEAYEQSALNVSDQGRMQELLSPMKVIEKLMNEHQIRVNTVIEEAELGYYSSLQVEEADYQVYVPVWRILADDQYFYVDAQKGEIQKIQPLE